MRASQWLLGLATAAATVAGVMSGCGGSTSGGNSNDSGAPDVTADHFEASVPEAAQEAAPESSVVDAPCVNDVIITSIPIPDGSVPGSDASAATCLSCVEAACPMLISECNATCGCPTAFVAFEQCVAMGGAFLTCAESNLTTAGLPLTDLTCATGCVSACGVTLPTEGGTGEGGSGEAAADSPSDATGQ